MAAKNTTEARSYSHAIELDFTNDLGQPVRVVTCIAQGRSVIATPATADAPYGACTCGAKL